MYLAVPLDDEDKTTSYSVAFVDLNGDGIKEAIVYIVGPHRCGTGGCDILILSPGQISYEVISGITVSREPIRVLATKSNGWSDLGVWVQGGGIRPGYEARLAFDGSTYPTNPTVAPAQKLDDKVAGTTILTPSSKRIPLYP